MTGAALVVMLAGRPVLQALAVLWAAVAFTEFRRQAVIGLTHIDARGRLTSRRIELSDLTRVGIGQRSRLWVQTSAPPVGSRSTLTYLRLIWPSGGAGNPSATDVLPIIRMRAERAGAALEPPLTGEPVPEYDGPRWFSM